MYGPVGLGSADIKGDLYLGPSASSSVTAPQVTGKIYTDFNVDYPDVVVPALAPSWPPAMPDGSGKYDFNWSTDWTVTDSTKIVVRPGVKVRLYVTATNFNPTSIQIESSNNFSGTLTIYQKSGIASFEQSGNIGVQSQQAQNFWYYGTTNVTSVKYDGKGNNNFFGVIYAPAANVTLNGGWDNTYNMNFIGACIAKTITINGRYNFHYDENLQKAGPIRGYVASAWEEL